MVHSASILTVGDPAPWFSLPDSNGKNIVLRSHAGKPILLVFYAGDQISECEKIACRLQDIMSLCDRFDLQIFSISLNPPSTRKTFAENHHLNYSLLSDLKGEVSTKYGAYICDGKNSNTIVYNRVAFLLDRNLRILKIYPLHPLEEFTQQFLGEIQDLVAQEPPRLIKMQAPVLLIPKVLDLRFCRELIHIWETQGNDESGFMKREGEKTVGYVDPSFKRRRDHFLQDGPVKNYIDSIMQRRVFPEILQAFQFQLTRRECYKIGCYDSESGGFFRPHRDNTTGGTLHRRFAMTINLNAEEYEGGCLRFPEHAPHLYKPATGDAIIFSCSTMHEATDVTSGRRFALLSFFYGDEDAEKRNAYENRVRNDYSRVIKLNA
ncbi:alkyl hydroperoxide reductase [Arthrospira sp. PCC 8006]|uniref:redoxin domain-containing protein n=1 Tax=Arthrospira sp. PCC 8006 TaxID=1982224 RepID=UPI00396D1B1A